MMYKQFSCKYKNKAKYIKYDGEAYANVNIDSVNISVTILKKTLIKYTFILLNNKLITQQATTKANIPIKFKCNKKRKKNL